MTLPAHWQRVQNERLLNDALANLTDPATAGVFGRAGVESAQRQIAWAHEVCRMEHVVLTAIRMRKNERAIDQLSLALPGLEPTASRDSRRHAVSGADLRPEITDEVHLDGEPVVCHRSIPVESPHESAVPGSQVQLVFLVPGSERGAVLTLASTAVGVEDLLQSDALEIAASVHIVNADQD